MNFGNALRLPGAGMINEITGMEYKICNLAVDENGCNLGEYRFVRTSDYLEKIAQKDKHQVTARATLRAGRNKESESILFEGGRSIYDVLFFYNFFARGVACLEEDRDRFNHYKVVEGIDFKGYSTQCISEAIEFIQSDNWKEWNENKIFAFHWFLSSRRFDSLQIMYFQKWVALDLLINGKGKKLKDYLKGVVKDATMVKDIVKYWRFIRNGYVHKGRCDYENFIKELEESDRKKFSDTLKNVFLTNIEPIDFDDFKGDSLSVMDFILTIVFSKIFGLRDLEIRGRINGWYFRKISEFFKTLKITQDNEGFEFVFNRS